MKITVEHKERDFNVALSSKDGAEPFLIIRGCRVVDGSKGRFVSWPSRKTEAGKWWSHCYSSDAFTQAVLKEYDATVPKAPTGDKAYADQDIPF